MNTHLEQLKPTIYSLFDHFHHNPEISWKEFKTTKFIKEFLQKEGFRVQTFDDCTGLVAEMGHGESCIALRTDMDALWQEVNGTFQANHSCGHDAHMTMAIGTALLLKRMKHQLDGRVKFIFQPAEEKGTGALKLIEKNILDDVDFLYGVHLRPEQELADGLAAPAICHGASKFLAGEILGEDIHAARPHLGPNAIEVAASIVAQIKGIHIDPQIPHSAKMTKLHAGGQSSNIIPGKASFSLDVRAQTNAAIEELTKKIEEVMHSTEILNNVKIKLEEKAYIAAAEVDEDAVAFMEQAIYETLGPECLTEPIVTSGGEDFHFYALKYPKLKTTMLGLGCGLTPGLHHPDMTFNREALFTGIEILARALILTSKGGAKGEVAS